MTSKERRAAVNYFIDGEVFGQQSNDAILQDGAESRSQSTQACQPLHLLERRRKLGWGFCWRSGYYLQPWSITGRVRLFHKLDRSLPDAQTCSHLYDVFMVSKSSLRPRATVRSLYRWSLYCNGYFYHLTAESRSGDPWPMSSQPKKSKREITPAVLKVEDLSSPNAPGHEAYVGRPGKPLMAYHIGQTPYSPEEIERIATWIIQHLTPYDFVESNCQHFALCLLARIVTHGRRFHVFFGTAPQLVLWDQWMRSRSPVEPQSWKNGFERGFELVPSHVPPQKRLMGFGLTWTTDNRANQLNIVWELGKRGAVPDNIIEKRTWRLQMYFPWITHIRAWSKGAKFRW